MSFRDAMSATLVVVTLAGTSACASQVDCDDSEVDEVPDADGPRPSCPEPQPEAEPEPERPGPEDDACTDLFGDACCETEGCGRGDAVGCVGEIRDCFLHRDLCRADEVCFIQKVWGDRGCDGGYGFVDGYVGVCMARDGL